jgi:type IX secretion system PorP/SprF family membrane protein
MRFNYLILILLFTFCFSFEAAAQWDAQVSQYWKAKTYFNPSFAAETDTLQASVLHRQQWVGIEHAPKTFIVSADMPLTFLGRKHGVGLLVMTESIGLFKNTLVGGQYVYKKRWKKNVLNIGVQLGYASIGFDASKIHIPDDQKEEIEVPTGGDGQSTAFDGNIGISWITPNYYVGISTSHITKPSFDIGDDMTSYISQTYYFTAGYNIKFRNPTYQLQPSVLIKSDAVVTQYEVTARLVYNKLFNGGLSWRKDDGFVFLLGANLYGFDAGYAFDLSTSAIAQASKGTHEFFLRYTIPMKKSKKGQNSHKSVRIL